MKVLNKAQSNQAKLSVKPSMKLLSKNEPKPKVLSELFLAVWFW